MLLILSATSATTKADTGTLRIVFGKIGLIAAVGSGDGVLTFHGKQYPFVVAGGSVGATVGVSTTALRGTASNLRAAGDLAGLYTGIDPMRTSATKSAVIHQDHI